MQMQTFVGDTDSGHISVHVLVYRGDDLRRDFDRVSLPLLTFLNLLVAFV